MGCMSETTATDTPQTQSPKIITWDEAKDLVATCRVREAYQSHSSDVWLTLKDGSEVQTKSPGLDLIIDELGAHPKCGDVAIILE
jgi:hypothetical protein